LIPGSGVVASIGRFGVNMFSDTVDNYYTKRVSYNKANGNKATAFYTEEGNWDLVGNNTPVFFYYGER